MDKDKMLDCYKKVLVLAPHTDDGELGAGGTIAKLVELGAEVIYIAFSAAEDSVPQGFPKNVLRKEVLQATNELGIKSENVHILNYKVRYLSYHRQDILEDLIKIRKKNNFDLVLTPSLKDVHQDHQAVAVESVRAFKNTSILGYELIWNNLSFDTTCFVSLGKSHMEKKLNALKQYKSQGTRNYLSEDFTYSLAKTRGVQSGCEYAECFEVIRMYL